MYFLKQRVYTTTNHEFLNPDVALYYKPIPEYILRKKQYEWADPEKFIYSSVHGNAQSNYIV